jgi:hypothetical protein
MSRWGSLIPGVQLTDNCDAKCFNFIAVDRFSLGFCIYHSLLMLLTIGVHSEGNPRASIHNGWWILKILIYFSLITGMFFIEPIHFRNYYVASFFFAAIYIVFQSFLLIDFAWKWSTNWVEKWENGSQLFKWLLIALTVIFYGLIISSSVILYINFTKKSGCSINTFLITFNLVLIFVFTVLCVLPKIQEKRPNAGVFQSGVLGVYTTYLIASSIVTQPNNADFSCSSGNFNEADPVLANVVMYVGLFLTFISICYQAFSIGSISNENLESDHNYSLFHFTFVLTTM